MDFLPPGEDSLSYESCTITAGDLKHLRNGTYQVIKNKQLKKIFKDLSSARKFMIKLELSPRFCQNSCQEGKDENPLAWYLSVTCSEYNLFENKKNLNGVAGLIHSFDVQNILQEEKL